MTPTLAELLASVEPSTVGPGPIDAIRDALEHAAQGAVAGVPADRLPLRVTKDRIARVLQCEHHAVITANGHELSEPVVRGRVLDRLLHHQVHGGGPAPGPALAIAEGAFEAERADDVVAWLSDQTGARERLAEDAGDFRARLTAWGSVDPDWWPRCEDRVRVDLAGGDVACAATFDLAVGGDPTGRPLVIAEVKSGRFTQEHRDGLFWYALLGALRHVVAPGAVIGWSAQDGRGWAQPVTAGLLEAAAQRGCAALERIGELERGRPPRRTACRACAWCSERDTCPDAAVVGGDDDDC